ncbi:MAG TPA: 3'-5' exonuclease, partial [Oceanipulchritudo sp.]|nr:3'-5' exonuclease [Oceanipulchritudo sp.]
QSWRSVPAILDCVNTLFGTGLSAGLIGAGVKARWEGSWAEHVPSPRTANLKGYAGWGITDSPEALGEGCIDLIRTIDPLSKGLSCAILVRTNTEVTELAQSLREAGIPASMEGVVNIARDNIAGAWILSFLYSMARPDETFPKAYLALQGLSIDAAEYRRLAGLIRTVLTEDGYAEAIRRLLSYLGPVISEDRFLRRRSEQLLEAATRFESTSMDSMESFIRFLEETTVKEASLRSQVQVMTVHKAKGLGFDVVIVAGFGGAQLSGSHQDSIHVHRNSTGEVGWILDLPRKAVYEQDPVLKQAHAQYEDDQTFEALCLLYVAMTRAKRALYCLAPVPSRNLSALTWQKLFETAMGMPAEPRDDGHVKWQREWGDSDWFNEVKVSTMLELPGIQLDTIAGALPELRPTLRRMASPSQEAHAGETAPRKLRSNAGRQFGTRMHDFLATIEWIPFDDPSAMQVLMADAEADLADRLQKVLETPVFREVFEKPLQPVHLWREKPYVLRRGDEIAHGIIDRATLLLDDNGEPERVVIYDFKTDALDPQRSAEAQLLERYALQVERYREAVSILTGLPMEVIEARLVPV